MSLLGRHGEFVAALREAGVQVSVAEDIDSVVAGRAIDVLHREQLRTAYAATVLKRQAHRAAFDTLFDLYYPPSLAIGERPPEEPVRRDDPELAAFRAELADALFDGDDARLRRLAMIGVGRFGGVPGRGRGSQGWSSYTAHLRIAPQTLTAGLLARMTDDGDADLAERAARAAIAARISRFRALLDAEVRRRVAIEQGPQSAARSMMRPGVEQRDLLSATQDDLAAIRREIAPLARRLAARLAIEQRRGWRGPLDFRRTIRASLSSGGIPVETVHRPRRPHKTDLVVLCDVSDSVATFARFTLLLVHAMREQFTRLRVFAFVDEVTEVSELFGAGVDVGESVGRLASAATRGWYGRTDYGRVFGVFCERHLDAITSRTSVLVLGDARSNYGDPALPALRLITSGARQAFWLNPERRSAWDTGDSVASRFADVVPMVECRNLAQLGGFVRALTT